MAIHLPTDLPTYRPPWLSLNPFNFHPLGWVWIYSIHWLSFICSPGWVWVSFTQFFFICSFRLESEFLSANLFSSAHFDWSLNFIQPIFFHLLLQLNLNSISQLFHLLAHSVESEIIQPTFPSTWLIWLSLKFIQPNFFICLLIWSSLKFIQLTFSSAHWVEFEFIQLTFSSGQLVESESGFELPGWVQII